MMILDSRMTLVPVLQAVLHDMLTCDMHMKNADSTLAKTGTDIQKEWLYYTYYNLYNRN